MSKLIEVAVTEREKQLKRQSTATTNPLIKAIIDQEIIDLRAAFAEQRKLEQPKK